LARPLRAYAPPIIRIGIDKAISGILTQIKLRAIYKPQVRKVVVPVLEEVGEVALVRNRLEIISEVSRWFHVRRKVEPLVPTALVINTIIIIVTAAILRTAPTPPVPSPIPQGYLESQLIPVIKRKTVTTACSTNSVPFPNVNIFVKISSDGPLSCSGTIAPVRGLKVSLFIPFGDSTIDIPIIKNNISGTVVIITGKANRDNRRLVKTTVRDSFNKFNIFG
jgi:hypothetical protein